MKASIVSAPRSIESGQLDDTVIVFTSDHGYFYGEYGLDEERRLAYEPTIRIPLIIRYPKLARGGSTADQMALSIDLAPTLLELAGVEPSRSNARSIAGPHPERARRKLANLIPDRVFHRHRLSRAF